MPPAKRGPTDGDDMMRDKSKAIQSVPGKGKKGSQLSYAYSARDTPVPNHNSLRNEGGSELQAQTGGSQIDWHAVPSELLHSYRHLHRLPVPSAYKNPTSHYVLSPYIGIGIGKYSPTMARRKTKQRMTHDQLATAVRKHFNAMAVREEDVIVETLYKAKQHDKVLSMKFGPLRKGATDNAGGGASANGQRGSLALPTAQKGPLK